MSQSEPGRVLGLLGADMRILAPSHRRPGGIWLALVRMGLLRVGERADARNWRPHPLVLAGEPARRWPLVDFANAITHNRGLVTVAKVLSEEDRTAPRRLRSRPGSAPS